MRGALWRAALWDAVGPLLSVPPRRACGRSGGGGRRAVARLSDWWRRLCQQPRVGGRHDGLALVCALIPTVRHGHALACAWLLQRASCQTYKPLMRIHSFIRLRRRQSLIVRNKHAGLCCTMVATPLELHSPRSPRPPPMAFDQTVSTNTRHTSTPPLQPSIYTCTPSPLTFPST